MGIREREIIAQYSNSHQGEGKVTLEMVDRLKPVGRALSDELPLRFMNYLSIEQLSWEWREKHFRILEEIEMVKPVEEWRGATVELTNEQKKQVSSAVGIVFRRRDLHERKERRSATVGTIRRATLEELEAIPQMGSMRAALLKEVFGEKNEALSEES